MKDWGPQRVEINRRVRSVLVTHFIDLGRLAIHVYPKKVSFRGSLCKMPGAPGGLSSDIVRKMFADIERIDGVKRVLTSFDNWFRNGTSDWVRVTDTKNTRGSQEQEQHLSKGHSGGQRDKTLKVDEKLDAAAPQSSGSRGAPQPSGSRGAP